MERSNISDTFPAAGIALGKTAAGSSQNQVTLWNLPIQPNTTLRIYRTKSNDARYSYRAKSRPVRPSRPVTGRSWTRRPTPRSPHHLARQRPFRAAAGDSPLWTSLTDQFPSLSISSLAFETTPPRVDGTLDSSYGPPLAVQTVGTAFGKNTTNDPALCRPTVRARRGPMAWSATGSSTSCSPGTSRPTGTTWRCSSTQPIRLDRTRWRDYPEQET